MRSCDENHDLLCVHDGADPDGERLLGNGREVAVEEAGVGLDGVLEGGGGEFWKLAVPRDAGALAAGKKRVASVAIEVEATTVAAGTTKKAATAAAATTTTQNPKPTCLLSTKRKKEEKSPAHWLH